MFSFQFETPIIPKFRANALPKFLATFLLGEWGGCCVCFDWEKKVLKMIRMLERPLAVDHAKTFQNAVFQFTRLPDLNACTAAMLLASTLFVAGCTSPNSTQTSPTTASSVACEANTDSFCVEGNEDSAARLNRQGLEQAGVGSYDQAVELFRQAIALDHSNSEYYFNLGVAYNYKQMPAETEATYLAGLAIQSSNSRHTQFFAQIYFNLACMYALQGKNELAFEQLEKVFSVDKNLLFHWVEADEDLVSLRDDPRFKQIMTRRDVEASNSPN